MEVRQAHLGVDRVSTRFRDMISFGRGSRLGSEGVTSDWEIAARLWMCVCTSGVAAVGTPWPE